MNKMAFFKKMDFEQMLCISRYASSVGSLSDSRPITPAFPSRGSRINSSRAPSPGAASLYTTTGLAGDPNNFYSLSRRGSVSSEPAEVMQVFAILNFTYLCTTLWLHFLDLQYHFHFPFQNKNINQSLLSGWKRQGWVKMIYVIVYTPVIDIIMNNFFFMT